jgi:hypothetical protein
MTKLTPTQRRALEATQRGTVTRTDTSTSITFVCPTVGARAIWALWRARLIADGPKTGKRIKMVLTRNGKAALG